MRAERSMSMPRAVQKKKQDSPALLQSGLCTHRTVQHEHNLTVRHAFNWLLANSSQCVQVLHANSSLLELLANWLLANSSLLELLSTVN